MRQASRGDFFLRAILSDAWSAVTARPNRSAVRRPDVTIHDPDAQKPKNLDDPFLDPEVQARIGKFIARGSAARSSKI